MKQVLLNVKESKYQFFLELLASLEFVQIEKLEGDSKADIEKNVRQGFRDLKKYKEGKLKTTPAKDFLHEL